MGAGREDSRASFAILAADPSIGLAAFLKGSEKGGEMLPGKIGLVADKKAQKGVWTASPYPRSDGSCHPFVRGRRFYRIKSMAASRLGDLLAPGDYPYRMGFDFRKGFQGVLVQGLSPKVRGELFAPKSAGGAACQ